MRNPDGDLLVDTSVAVAFLVADHEHHAAVVGLLKEQRLGLAGHAAFETYSVLTRMPTPVRRSAAVVSRLLAHNFPATRFLGVDATRRVFDSLAERRISGGSVYDALVAAVAHEHGLTLATRDRRALDTYRSIGVSLHVM